MGSPSVETSQEFEAGLPTFWAALCFSRRFKTVHSAKAIFLGRILDLRKQGLSISGLSSG